jgi:hypothetical protein
MNARSVLSALSAGRVAAAAAAVAALAITLAGCGGGSADPPAQTGTISAGHHSGGARTSKTSGSAPAKHRAAATAAGNRCTLPVILAISGESSSEDAARTAGWVTLQANGWTVFAPNGDWHLSASQGGIDVVSPDGESDASLESWPAQSPWTFASLSREILGNVTDIHVICQTAVERDSAAASQATEFTGDDQGREIHAVMILSLETPTVPDLYYGETHFIYTPAAQWSPAAAQTLMLITKRAILVPQQP